MIQRAFRLDPSHWSKLELGWWFLIIRRSLSIIFLNGLIKEKSSIIVLYPMANSSNNSSSLRGKRFAGSSIEMSTSKSENKTFIYARVWGPFDFLSSNKLAKWHLKSPFGVTNHFKIDIWREQDTCRISWVIRCRFDGRSIFSKQERSGNFMGTYYHDHRH